MLLPKMEATHPHLARTRDCAAAQELLGVPTIGRGRAQIGGGGVGSQINHPSHLECTKTASFPDLLNTY
jgi:hypothetical protein